MNLFDQVFDLTSQATKGPVQQGMPKGARGFIILFEPDANGSLSGNVRLHLGQGANAVNRLAFVNSGTLRTGTVSDREQTAFTLTFSTGAAGFVRVKFTSEDQPEASYSL